MKPLRLPILLCHANCPNCGLPTEFKMFESGGGGDFSTYIGAKTGTVYRLDLGKIHYQKIPLSKLLSPAIDCEGALLEVPREIKCKICGSALAGAHTIGTDGEEMIEAHEL